MAVENDLDVGEDGKDLFVLLAYERGERRRSGARGEKDDKGERKWNVRLLNSKWESSLFLSF